MNVKNLAKFCDWSGGRSLLEKFTASCEWSGGPVVTHRIKRGNLQPFCKQVCISEEVSG